MRSTVRWLGRIALVAATTVACVAAWGVPPASGTPEPKEDAGTFERRLKWFQQSRLGPDGKLHPNARNAALRQRERNLARGILGSTSAIEGDRWVFLGPAPIHDGEAAYAGRISALAAHPTDPLVVYAGAAQGGVWKTTNGGASWIPLTDQQDSLAVGSVALAPSNPDVVYVGTGEANQSCSSFFGAGILKSMDGGETWSLLGQIPFAGTSVGSLVVHPDDPDVIWAGNTSGQSGFSCSEEGSGLYGVWKSVDGGQTWTLINGGWSSPLGSSDIVLVPDDPDSTLR